MGILRNAVALLFILVPQLSAQQADEIAKKSFSLERPKAIRMNVQMNLISPQNTTGTTGTTRSRDIEVVQKGDDMRFIRFVSPRDVAGTKFLSFKKIGKNNRSITETRMFTPSDSKIRSITTSTKKNSFMGSDLSYYDLEDHSYEDFTYTLLAKGQKIADKSFVNRSFYTLRVVPHDKNSPYSSMIYWIDTETYQIRRIEGFENTIKVKDIYILQNLEHTAYFIPKIMLAVNYKKNGHRTVWQVQEAEIDPLLPSHIFSMQNLN